MGCSLMLTARRFTLWTQAASPTLILLGRVKSELQVKSFSSLFINIAWMIIFAFLTFVDISRPVRFIFSLALKTKELQFSKDSTFLP